MDKGMLGPFLRCSGGLGLFLGSLQGTQTSFHVVIWTMMGGKTSKLNDIDLLNGEWQYVLRSSTPSRVLLLLAECPSLAWVCLAKPGSFFNVQNSRDTSAKNAFSSWFPLYQIWSITTYFIQIPCNTVCCFTCLPLTLESEEVEDRNSVFFLEFPAYGMVSEA